MIKVNLARDNNGVNLGLRPQSDTINGLLLATDTSENQAIPSGAKYVFINSDVDIYVKLGTDNTVAATKTTDTTDGTASELNPVGYAILSGQTYIAVIAGAPAHVTFSYYS